MSSIKSGGFFCISPVSVDYCDSITRFVSRLSSIAEKQCFVIDVGRGEIRINPQLELINSDVLGSVLRYCLENHLEITQNIKVEGVDYCAQVIGQGGYNRVYKIDVKGKFYAVKVAVRTLNKAKGVDEALSQPERACRVMNETSRDWLEPAVVNVEVSGQVLTGLMLNFIDSFRQASNVEISLGMIQRFIEERLVMDAHAEHNFVVLSSGETMLMDVDQAMRRDSEVSREFLATMSLEKMARAQSSIMTQAMTRLLGQSLWKKDGSLREKLPLSENEKKIYVEQAFHVLFKVANKTDIFQNKRDDERCWKNMEACSYISTLDLRKIFDDLLPLFPSPDAGTGVPVAVNDVELAAAASAGESKAEVASFFDDKAKQGLLSHFFSLLLYAPYKYAHDIREQIRLMDEVISRLQGGWENAYLPPGTLRAGLYDLIDRTATTSLKMRDFNVTAP